MPRNAQAVNPLPFVKWAALALLVIVLAFGSFGTVQAGNMGIKTRFGAVVGVITPGPYFKIPFVEKVRSLNVQTLTSNFEKEASLAAASKDLQDVAIEVVVNFHVAKDTAGDVYSQYGTSESYKTNVVEPLMRDTVKTLASQYNAEELVTKRADFNQKVTALLDERLAGKLVILESVNVVNFAFSKDFTNAIEAKVTAVQNAEAAKNKLVQVQAEADQRVAQAKGEAEAIRIQAQAVNAQGGADYVELQRIKAWDGHGCTSYCGMTASTGLLVQGK